MNFLLPQRKTRQTFRVMLFKPAGNGNFVVRRHERGYAILNSAVETLAKSKYDGYILHAGQSQPVARKIHGKLTRTN